ncbi:MAG: FAD-dependent oxidoreductase [Peptococcaceae bacterium]|nr:FAD-binding oxidoreductase [Peptococcaceae bacterium]MDH7524630.1 FAD-dependent oxidoreductase [Peptococcaceae bacterium]
MQEKYDAIIVGGGIIGLSTAYYLTASPRKVLLIEKKEFGSGASGACDDQILLQSKRPGILLTLALESLEHYRRLEKDLPLEIDLENAGGMIFIETQEQLPIMEDFVNQQHSCGLDVTFLDKKEMKKLHPHVSPHVLASTYSPLDSQVNPLKTMRAFAAAAQDRGLKIKKGSKVQSIEFISDYNWKVVCEDGQRFYSESVINAAGAWAGELAGQLGIDIPIRPKRGQIAVTEQIPRLGKTNFWNADYIVMKLYPSLAKSRRQILNDLGIGLAVSQTGEGNYFIGGTREYAGYDNTTSCEAIRLVIGEAARFFPILKNVHIIRTFAGLRPASDDGKPFIGPVSRYPGFYMAAGHEGDGIALAPITGKLIALMLDSETLPHDISELSPDRCLQYSCA